ncbi:hypothetical protein APR04_003793 [Promicromonospora umidemergens]|uniref:Phage terminase large subunit-like protein n=1 Tax=Promicromonospora umidemergens TaxID=629679 RepID=A0ABP8XH63_9MICO|nr:hypothetical protein [Promicromonospora umidemergens]MCP2284870.1 hypothetical protein [Promicromonospora umidemergens]
MARDRAEAVPLFHTPRHPTRDTTGNRKAGVARALGMPFIPWQREMADVWGELDGATGTYWYDTLVLLGLRQTGKTTFTLTDQLETALYFPGSVIRYTAQTQTMGLARLENDFYVPISDSPLSLFLDKRYGRRTQKLGWDGRTGSEQIRFLNRSRWETEAVKEESGHGPALTKGVVDEAFAHETGAVEQAMRPAMQTIDHAQIIIASAAGTAKSKYLAGKREQEETRFQSLVEQYGPLGPTRSRTMFVQYAAPLDADPADPATWWGCHPGLGWLTTEAKISAALEATENDPWEFYRPYLGWWKPTGADEWVIPQASVKACIVGADDPNDWTGDPVWAVDVSPDRSLTTVALAGVTPGARCWVEIAEQDAGTAWVVSLLKRLRGELGGNTVAIDGAGGAGALEQDLIDAGFDVVRLSHQQKVDGCGGLFDDFAQQNVRFGGDSEIVSAIKAAAKKKTGTDAFIWAKGKSLGDITALYGVTLARQALVMKGVYDPMEHLR